MIFKHLNFVNISRMNISTIENATGVLLTLGLVFQDQMEILKVSTHITKTHFKTTRHSHFTNFSLCFLKLLKKSQSTQILLITLSLRNHNFQPTNKKSPKTWLLKSCIRSLKQVIIFRTRRMPHKLPQQQFAASTTSHESTTSTILSMTKRLLSKFTN